MTDLKDKRNEEIRHYGQTLNIDSGLPMLYINKIIMKAEIINIGDELLIGQVVNTNSSWIAKQLNMAGIEVCQITTIADNKQHIITALNQAKSRADIILITGGLGPTKDDITKQTLCEYFNTQIVFNNQIFKDIKKIFKIRGFDLTEPNRKQAEVPENCIVIRNVNGTAPGMWFEKDKKIFVSMPGVPFEMKPMINNFVIPYLLKHFTTKTIIHKTILTQGIAESFLFKIIENWENNLPSYIKLAYLPSPGIVRLRLSGVGDNKKKLLIEINKHISYLQKIIPQYIYGYDNDKLEKIVGDLLIKNNKTLSIAESCSGGYIAHKITSVPGSSMYFKGSVVSYSNEIKINLLEVNSQIISEKGAVSKEVVTEMVRNVKKNFNTDYAIATSGIAGPSGGSSKKPVGTTWIAIASSQKIIVKKYLFGENRERNIVKTSLTALNMLRKSLIDT